MPALGTSSDICVSDKTLNETLAVRCCGDEVVPNREVSTASCADLKWDENTGGSQHVCGNSEVGGTCLANLVSRLSMQTSGTD